MEYNKNVDMQVALDYVNEQIKDKSKIWAAKLVDKIHIEKTMPITAFSDEVMANYEKVSNLIKGKSEQQIQKIIYRLSEQEKEDYKKVGSEKQDKDRLEESVDGMKKLEDFLDVVAELKEELIGKLK